MLLAIDQGTTGSSEGVSDLLETPVEVARELEATGLGAALLAGLAVGTWPDVAALEGLRRPGTRYEPRLDPDEVLALRAGWREALARTIGR